MYKPISYTYIFVTRLIVVVFRSKVKSIILRQMRDHFMVLSLCILSNVELVTCRPGSIETSTGFAVQQCWRIVWDDKFSWDRIYDYNRRFSRLLRRNYSPNDEHENIILQTVYGITWIICMQYRKLWKFAGIEYCSSMKYYYTNTYLLIRVHKCVQQNYNLNVTVC